MKWRGWRRRRFRIGWKSHPAERSPVGVSVRYFVFHLFFEENGDLDCKSWTHFPRTNFVVVAFRLKKMWPEPTSFWQTKWEREERRVTRWKRPMNDVPINSLNWSPLSAHPPVVELLETMAPTFFRPISYNDHVASNVDDFDDFSRLFPVFLAAIAPVSGPRTSPPRPAFELNLRFFTKLHSLSDVFFFSNYLFLLLYFCFNTKIMNY